MLHIEVSLLGERHQTQPYSMLRLARSGGGRLHLAGVQGRPRQLLVMTRLLGAVFTDYATVEDAVAAFEAYPPLAA